MSKKLINSPDTAVDEALGGLVAVHPGLILLENHRVVLRADIEEFRHKNKVTLLSGGGSGHEPAHGGYVGRGMLSAAVAGAVFTSPPPESILAALRAISSPAGTLMIIKNYTGDRLNFGIAAERAKNEGMKVNMVVVGEDTALPSHGRSAGRRGLCGTVFVHKIAGALAEDGCSLDVVTAAAQEVADTIATMSVSLSPCSVPGHKPSFTLSEDEMELGLGIHGEAGAERTKILPANDVIAKILNHMTSKEPGFKYFELPQDSDVALIVNNLGGTSNLELSLVAGAAIDYLTKEMKFNVTRAYMGAFMTSLEMAGVSLTLLKMKPKWAECLDRNTNAPGWPNISLGPDGTANRIDLPAKATEKVAQTSSSSKDATQTKLGLKMRKCMENISWELIAAEDELNQLDRGSGDGDCGTTMKSGAEAILKNINTIPWDNPSLALLSLSNVIESSMGGTSGAIYTLFLTSAAGALGQGDTLEQWIRSLSVGIDAIKRYGGADTGDRTMLDALVPALDSMQGLEHRSADIIITLTGAVEAAREGVEKTRTMSAGAGRASYVHFSQLTQPDPGATAVYKWLKAILKTLNSTI